MKKVVGILLIVTIIFSACSEHSRKAKFDTNPKPYYKTAKGKKKQNYYNQLQFGGKSASATKKSNKK
jgi:hypothetical protein